MATLQEAVKSAMQFAQATLGEERARDLRLEEIESATTADGPAWLITLSMPEPLSGTAVDEALQSFGRRQREYKTFTVIKHTGEVITMKVRVLAID